MCRGLKREKRRRKSSALLFADFLTDRPVGSFSASYSMGTCFVARQPIPVGRTGSQALHAVLLHLATPVSFLLILIIDDVKTDILEASHFDVVRRNWRAVAGWSPPPQRDARGGLLDLRGEVQKRTRHGAI